jgi:hypothetical protein
LGEIPDSFPAVSERSHHLFQPGDGVARSGLDERTTRQGCLALVAVVSGGHHVATGDRHGGGHRAGRFRPHDRGDDYIEAWLALTEPPGWDEAGLARLRAYLEARDKLDE